MKGLGGGTKHIYILQGDPREIGGGGGSASDEPHSGICPEPQKEGGTAIGEKKSRRTKMGTGPYMRYNNTWRSQQSPRECHTIAEGERKRPRESGITRREKILWVHLVSTMTKSPNKRECPENRFIPGQGVTWVKEGEENVACFSRF